MLINERPEENRHPDFDSEASLKEAKSILPLHRLMEQHGNKPPGEKWGPCPFCKKKDTARIKATDGQEFFKCANDNCPSATSDTGKAWTEIHYLRFVTGLNQKDAFIAYLKEAGVWRDRTKFKKSTDTTKSATEIPAGEGAAGKADGASVPTKPDEASSASAMPGTGAPVQQSPGVEAPGDVKSPESLLGKGGPQGDCGSAPGTSAPIKQPSPTPDAALAGANNAAAASSSNFTGPAAPSGPVSSKPSAKPEPPAEPDGCRSLREFFSRLNLTNADRDILFDKRGLKWLSCHALRFRSNPKANEAILRELLDKYGPKEMLASGLWIERDRKQQRRPNKQFFGFGIKGKKKFEEGSEDTGDFIWGWTHPVLIPYFDENGELVGLRPHKGMGRSGTLVGTPQVYIPRGAGGPKDGAPETFHTVVVTEGEFKAAALWQSLGVWRTDGKDPIGVAALPGISFGKNYEVREVLEDWLRRVKCREVIVVFDNEEKGDPNLDSYKPDRRKRFDAARWARFLATSLAMKLHIYGKVGTLPNSWRNAKGKADWDGAAAEMAKGKQLEVLR